jgi:hypothetical protein
LGPRPDCVGVTHTESKWIFYPRARFSIVSLLPVSARQ